MSVLRSMARGLRWLLLGDPVKPRPEPKAAPPPRRPARRSFGFEQFSDGFENIPAGARKVIDAVTGRSAEPLPRTGVADAFEPATRPLVSLSGQEPLLPLVDEPELPPPPAADGFFVASLDDLVLPEVAAPAPGAGGAPPDAGHVEMVERASAAATEATPPREPGGEVPVTTPPLARPEDAGVLMPGPGSSSTAASSAGSGGPGPEAGEGAARPSTNDRVASVGFPAADPEPGEVNTPPAPHLAGPAVAVDERPTVPPSGWAASAADLGDGARVPDGGAHLAQRGREVAASALDPGTPIEVPVGGANRLQPPDAGAIAPLDVGLAVPADSANGAKSLPVVVAASLDTGTSNAVPGGDANRLQPLEAGAIAPLDVGLVVPADGANGAQSLPVVVAASLDTGTSNAVPGGGANRLQPPDAGALAPLDVGLAVPADSANGAQVLPFVAAVALDPGTPIEVPGGGAKPGSFPAEVAAFALSEGPAMPAAASVAPARLSPPGGTVAASDADPASPLPQSRPSPEPPRPDGVTSAAGLGGVRLAQPDSNRAALDAGAGSATPTSASVESLAAATVDTAATLLQSGREAGHDEPLGTGAPPPDPQRDSPVPTRDALGPASPTPAEPADDELDLPASFLSLAFRVDRDRAPKPAQPRALPPADFLADVSDLGVLAEPASEAPAPAAPVPPPSKPDGEPPTS